MNEHEANAERVDLLGRALDDAMLDALNRLPPEDRAAAADKVRERMSDPVRFVIVDQLDCRVCGAPLWLNGACPSCPSETGTEAS